MYKILIVLLIMLLSKICFADISNETTQYNLLSNNFEISDEYYYFPFDNFEKFENKKFLISNNQAIVVSQIKNNEFSDMPSNEKFKNLYEFKISTKNIHNEKELIIIFKKHFSKNWIFFSTSQEFTNRLSFFSFFIKNFIFDKYDKKYITHHELNYKLNGWIVKNPREIISDNYHYIYYTPQFYYEIGILISFIFSSLMFIFLIFYLIKIFFGKINV